MIPIPAPQDRSQASSLAMKAWAAYLTLAIVWGSTYFAIALGIQSFTTFGMVAIRYVSAGLVALALARILKEPLPEKRDLPHLVLMGVLLLTVSNGLVTYAERTVSSGVAAVLCSLTPVVYAGLGRERLGPRTWMGLALGLGGVLILMLSKPGDRRMDPLGVALILLAVFAWAFGTLHGRRHVKGHGMAQTGIQMLTGGLLALLLMPFTGGVLHAPLSWRAALAVGYLAVFGSLVAFSAYIFLSRTWSPTKMSTYVYINPLVAVSLGCAFLGEPLNPAMGLGMAVILSGVALLQMPRFPKAQTESKPT